MIQDLIIQRQLLLIFYDRYFLSSFLLCVFDIYYKHIPPWEYNFLKLYIVVTIVWYLSFPI